MPFLHLQLWTNKRMEDFERLLWKLFLVLVYERINVCNIGLIVEVSSMSHTILKVFER